jgi:hypothetical protein
MIHSNFFSAENSISHYTFLSKKNFLLPLRHVRIAIVVLHFTEEKTTLIGQFEIVNFEIIQTNV